MTKNGNIKFLPTTKSCCHSCVWLAKCACACVRVSVPAHGTHERGKHRSRNQRQTRPFIKNNKYMESTYALIHQKYAVEHWGNCSWSTAVAMQWESEISDFWTVASCSGSMPQLSPTHSAFWTEITLASGTAVWERKKHWSPNTGFSLHIKEFKRSTLSILRACARVTTQEL